MTLLLHTAGVGITEETLLVGDDWRVTDEADIVWKWESDSVCASVCVTCDGHPDHIFKSNTSVDAPDHHGKAGESLDYPCRSSICTLRRKCDGFKNAPRGDSFDGKHDASLNKCVWSVNCH